MLMNLLNSAGQRTEAVLLAAGDNKIRIVVRGLKDATELRLIGDRWMSENEVVVEIESLITGAATIVEPSGIEFNRVLDSRKAPRTMTAGS